MVVEKKSPRKLLAWSQGYLEKKYKMSGAVEISFEKDSIYYFNDQAIESYLNSLKNNFNLQNKRTVFYFQKERYGLNLKLKPDLDNLVGLGRQTSFLGVYMLTWVVFIKVPIFF